VSTDRSEAACDTPRSAGTAGTGAAARDVPEVSTRPGGTAANRQIPPPVGRPFDPDWSLGLVLFAVVWFAAVIVGAWFFWSNV